MPRREAPGVRNDVEDEDSGRFMTEAPPATREPFAAIAGLQRRSALTITITIVVFGSSVSVEKLCRLHGEAAVWFRGVKSSIASWEDALQRLRAMYGAPRPPHIIFRDIFASEQGDREQSEVFIGRLRASIATLPSASNATCNARAAAAAVAVPAVVSAANAPNRVAQQQFIEVPSYTEVDPDENALLICRVSNKRGVCSWQRNNKPVGMHRGKYEWATPRTRMTGDCSIVIHGAKLHMDSGNWQCQVTPSNFDMQDALSSPPAALVVRAEPEPPRILFNGTLLEPKRKIMLSAGTRAAVVCKVRYGSPPAHVEWHLDSRRLTPLSQMNTSEIGKPDLWTTRSILEIEATRFGYGKQLACRAYHPSYPVPHYRNAYALLDVAYIPLVSIIGAEKNVISNLEEGISTLSLECKADGNPAPSVWWTKDGQEIMTNGSRLIIAPVTRKHSGIYGCLAKNDLGISESIKIEIDVKYPPRVIWVGPELRLDVDLYSQTTFECIADGNPTPSYQWYHCPRTMDINMCLDGYIMESGSHLSLYNVTYSHRGSYACIVENLIGTKRRSHRSKALTLNVSGPPATKDVEIVHEGKSNMALLKTTICAEPPPKAAHWIRENLRFDVPSAYGRYEATEKELLDGCYLYTLIVEDVTSLDEGNYKFYVENDKGVTNYIITMLAHVKWAELGTEVVVAKIHVLGLEIAPNKTKALWFHRLPRTREPPDSRVRVGEHDVTLGRYMKYLGLTLDSRWGFGEQFDRLVLRIERIACAMHRLPPYLGGPTEEVRHSTL
ncbi:irregular chiasm C-roughest protein-like [Battus philenor]|uniref:irregular chiasm C-roughest protein-like n=1 Tax=Battus philenor TaxID=42288 RepID=UPI0035CF6944